MWNLEVNALALVAGLAFSTTAMAGGMSKAQYQSVEKSIDAEFTAAKASCASLAGNAADICLAQAKGKAGVSKADLEAQYEPSAKNGQAARVARADAEYAVALERCDDKAGNVKDVCVKTAMAAKVHAIANADTWMKTSEANAKASETSAEAKAKASETSAKANAKATEAVTDARRDAAAEKRDADYAVAKEKCDALAGDAKDLCINDAKARFSQH